MKRTLAQIIREEYNDDPVAYCNATHPDATPWKLQREKYVLWKILLKRGLLKNLRRVKVDFGDDSYKTYLELYPDEPCTGELRLLNGSLYNRMRRDGNIKKVPKSDRIKTLLENAGLKYCSKNLSLYFKKLGNGELRS